MTFCLYQNVYWINIAYNSNSSISNRDFFQKDEISINNFASLLHTVATVYLRGYSGYSLCPAFVFSCFGYSIFVDRLFPRPVPMITGWPCPTAPWAGAQALANEHIASFWRLGQEETEVPHRSIRADTGLLLKPLGGNVHFDRNVSVEFLRAILPPSEDTWELTERKVELRHREPKSWGHRLSPWVRLCLKSAHHSRFHR